MTQQEKKRLEEKEQAARAKPSYSGSYEQALSDSSDKLSAREDFSYDMNADGLYRQYKDQYIAGGERAMRDSMGQAAALTGGYGSSYAQSLGQQSYNEHLSELGQIVPELYTLAWQRYLNEGEEMEAEHQRLQKLRDDEYERYTDALAAYERQEQRDWERRQEELETQRASEQQDYKRALEQAETLAKYGNFDGYARLYGEDVAEKMRNYWISSNPEAALQQGLISLERYYALTGYSPEYRVSGGNSGTFVASIAKSGAAGSAKDEKNYKKSLREDYKR